jgi:hypothetical protein
MTRSLPVVLLLGLCLAGCQSIEEREHGELAEIARAHADEREQARARALPVEASLRPALERRSGIQGCGSRVRTSQAREGIALVACGEFGDFWPLRVQWGYLRCEPAFKKGRYRLIFSAPSSRDYGLNWRARGVGYPSIDPVLRDEAGGSADAGVLVKRARTLCGGA